MIPQPIILFLLPLAIAFAIPHQLDGFNYSCSPSDIASIHISHSTPTFPSNSQKTTPIATPTAFTIFAAHSGSPIHLQPINAASQAFFIGQAPATYCPSPPVENCPPGTSTALLVNDGRSSLVSRISFRPIKILLAIADLTTQSQQYTEVPGGQLIYVAATGALGFTEAHYGTTPPGAALTGFIESSGLGYGSFRFTGLGATGFLACPNANGTAPYQVFANVRGLTDADVPGGSVRHCIGFDALTTKYNGTRPAAWEYT
ncbi:hypothetical protein MMC12_005318 [Toensbergia leucococca]|nr:hypothetical protein [Toensbergia leucococca]